MPGGSCFVFDITLMLGIAPKNLRLKASSASQDKPEAVGGDKGLEYAHIRLQQRVATRYRVSRILCPSLSV
jgi:hypothetical protein